MINASALREFLSDSFDGGKAVVEIDGKPIPGMMYGDDECFDCGINFYQYFVSDDGELYKLYYDVDGSPLDEIDYDHPVDYEHATIDPDADPDYLSWDDISFSL